MMAKKWGDEIRKLNLDEKRSRAIEKFGADNVEKTSYISKDLTMTYSKFIRVNDFPSPGPLVDELKKCFVYTKIPLTNVSWPMGRRPLNPIKQIKDVSGNSGMLSISSAFGSFSHLAFENALLNLCRTTPQVIDHSGLRGNLSDITKATNQFPSIVRYAADAGARALKDHFHDFKEVGMEQSFAFLPSRLSSAYFQDDDGVEKCWEAHIDCVATTGTTSGTRVYQAIELKTKWGEKTEPSNEDYRQAALQMWAMKDGMGKNTPCSVTIVVIAIAPELHPPLQIGINTLKPRQSNVVISLLRKHLKGEL